MMTISRLSLLVLCGLVLVAGTCLASGLVKDPIGALLQEQRRGEELLAKQQSLLHIYERKCTLVQALIEDHVSLLDAAHEFGRLHAEVYTGEEPWLTLFPLPTSEEGLCEYVIQWVEGELKSEPEQHDTVIHRLETDLHRLFPHPSTGAHRTHL
jgi:hypothetical protein